MKSVIPSAAPTAHTRNRTESLPSHSRYHRSQPFVEELLKVSRQLTQKHVQLMQSKLRFKDSLSVGACGYRRKSGIDESCSAMCDDSLPAVRPRPLDEIHEEDLYRWEGPSRAITPVTYAMSRQTKHTPSSDAERAPTRRIASRTHRLRKLFPIEAPLSIKAKEARQILAPLSRRVYPRKFASGRRPVSSSRFTLEDFYEMEVTRNAGATGAWG